jgi:hypothetical protein
MSEDDEPTNTKVLTESTNLKAKRIRTSNTKLAEYEVSSDSATAAALQAESAILKKQQQANKRRVSYKRDRHKIGPFDAASLASSNPYNLSSTSGSGFSVGDRVCVKDFFYSEGT